MGGPGCKKVSSCHHCLSPCFSQKVTAPRADLGSKNRLQTGTSRSRELGTDARVSSNGRSPFDAPTASTDELRGTQRDPGSGCNFSFREACPDYPKLNYPRNGLIKSDYGFCTWRIYFNYTESNLKLSGFN